MGLKDLGVVDIVMREPGGGSRTALIIVDGGDISDHRAREAALQEKLTAYLNFVSSGQFAENYPQLAGTIPFVRVICRTAPTAGMMQIEGVRSRTDPGISLPVEIVNEEEFRRALKLKSGRLGRICSELDRYARKAYSALLSR